MSSCIKMKFDKFHNKSFLFSILSNKDHLPKANGYLLLRIIIQELKVASATFKQARCLLESRKKRPFFSSLRKQHQLKKIQLVTFSLWVHFLECFFCITFMQNNHTLSIMGMAIPYSSFISLPK